MTEDQKILKKISNKIKRIAKGDVAKIENDATREPLQDLMDHIAVMLTSAAGKKTKGKEENV